MPFLNKALQCSLEHNFAVLVVGVLHVIEHHGDGYRLQGSKVGTIRFDEEGLGISESRYCE